jgi:hypothetical protein
MESDGGGEKKRALERLAKREDDARRAYRARRPALPDASLQIQLAPRGSGENGWSVSEKPPRADVIAFAAGNCHAGGDQGVAAATPKERSRELLLSATCDRAVRAPRNAYAHCFGCCKRPINFSIDPLPPSSPAPPPTPPPLSINIENMYIAG